MHVDHEDDWGALLDIRDQLHAEGVSTFDEGARSMLSKLYNFLGGDSGWVMLAHQCLPEHERAEDPLGGWRARHFARVGERAEEQTRAVQSWIARRQLLMDPVTKRVLDEAGSGARAYWQRAPGFIDWNEGHDNPTIELNDLLGIHDRVFGAESIHDAAEVWVGVDVDAGTGRSFSAAAATTLERALRVFRPTLVRWATIFGLRCAQKPLSPREREVLERLLAGRSEQEIAYDTGLTAGSVHQVAQRVYRKFEVNSRGELHALCSGVPLDRA